MSPKLLVNDGAAWERYISSSHKLEDYSAGLFQNMIDSILLQMPDIVLLPGDISKDGEKLSHEYVAEGLTRLTDAGIKVYVVPGNHDIGYIENAQYFDGDRQYKAENITSNEFARLYAKFGYEGTARDENSLSYAAEPVDGLVILGIDSHTGKIGGKELDWVCDQAQTARQNGKQVIAMMHHPIMEHFNDQEETKSNAILKNADEVRSNLMDAGIHIVFTGHFHTTDVAMAYNENHTDSIFDITTGSKISYPMHHRWVKISEDMSQMNINTFMTECIDGHPEILDVAKDRLSKCIEKKLESKGVSFMTSVACQATFIHCEGNEHEANGVNLIDSIPFLVFIVYPEAWYAINSMLDDYSFYGDENQNRVDDLNPTFRISDAEIVVPASITNIAADKEDEDLYNIMGQKVNEKTRGIVVQGGSKKLLR